MYSENFSKLALQKLNGRSRVGQKALNFGIDPDTPSHATKRIGGRER